MTRLSLCPGREGGEIAKYGYDLFAAKSVGEALKDVSIYSLTSVLSMSPLPL